MSQHSVSDKPIKLKEPLPCPFCGDRDISMAKGIPGNTWWAWCKVCDTTGPEANTERGAVVLWNNLDVGRVALHNSMKQ